MDEFALIRHNFIEIAPDPSGKNGKPGPNPKVQCVNCDHTFKDGVTAVEYAEDFVPWLEDEEEEETADA